MKIKVELTHDESEEIFFDILCNAVGMGYINGYGIELNYSRDHYKDVAQRLRGSEFSGCVPTYERVLLGILQDGGKLSFVDVECDGEYSRTVTLKDVHEKIQNAPIENIKNILDEVGDVEDGDVILQHMLYGEVIFG